MEASWRRWHVSWELQEVKDEPYRCLGKEGSTQKDIKFRGPEAGTSQSSESAHLYPSLFFYRLSQASDMGVITPVLPQSYFTESLSIWVSLKSPPSFLSDSLSITPSSSPLWLQLLTILRCEKCNLSASCQMSAVVSHFLLPPGVN